MFQPRVRKVKVLSIPIKKREPKAFCRQPKLKDRPPLVLPFLNKFIFTITVQMSSHRRLDAKTLPFRSAVRSRSAKHESIKRASRDVQLTKTRAELRGGQRWQLPRAPRWKGAPRDEIYLFQIKYSFEKFRDSEAIQEYNSILYSYVALCIKGPQQELISLQV